MPVKHMLAASAGEVVGNVMYIKYFRNAKHVYIFSTDITLFLNYEKS